MKIEKNNILKNLDQILDYVPFVSTITNLIDIIQKKVFVDKQKPAILEKNTYYKYLHSKDIKRCIILLIPIIGNVIVAIKYGKKNPNKQPAISKQIILSEPSQADPNKIETQTTVSTQPVGNQNKENLLVDQLNDEQKKLLEQLRDDNFSIADLSDKQKKLLANKGFVLNILDKGLIDITEIYDYLDEDLSNDPTIVLMLVSKDGLSLKNLPMRWKKDPQIVKAAILQNGLAIAFAYNPLRFKSEMRKIAIGQNGEAIFTYGNINYQPKDLLLLALESSLKVFESLSDQWKKDPDILNKALEKGYIKL